MAKFSLRATFDYSDDEWNEIAKSLSAIDDRYFVDKNVKLTLLRAANYNPISMRDSLPHVIKEASDRVAAIEKLQSFLSEEADIISFSEGIPEYSPYKEIAEKLLPQLNELRLMDKRSAAYAIEHQQWFDENYPKRGGNRNEYRNRLFAVIASVWTGAGGEINHGQLYRRFFEAVAKPPASDKRIRDVHRFGLAETTFANHVAAYQKAHEIAGARGPKRNSILPRN